MIIRPGALGPLANAGEGQVPKNLSADTRFKDIMLMFQQDGVIAADASAPVEELTEVQKVRLRDEFDIDSMGTLAEKRALLNKLVRLGALTSEESELSGMQLLPPAMGGGIVAGQQFAGLEEMLDEPNYISHLEQAIRQDELWSRSDDVVNARAKLLGLLQDIYT